MLLQAMPYPAQVGGVITFVGSYATGFTGDGGTVNFSNLRNSAGAAPTLAQGDIVIAMVGRDNQSSFTMSASDLYPSGYTSIRTDFTSGSHVGGGLSYKVMGSTPDTSLAISNTGTGGSFGTASVSIIVLRGVDPSSPIDAAVAVATSASGPPNAPSVTPASTGAIVFAAGFSTTGNNSVTTDFTRPSNLDSSTNAYRTYRANVGGGSFQACTGAGFASWTSGAFDPDAFTGDANWGAGRGYTLALRPLVTASYAWTADVTVASGTVGSNLTNFPLYIDLADMPSTFWANTSGTDIEAYVGSTRIACDVLWCDPVTETGSAFVKVPTLASGSDTTITLKGTGNRYNAVPTNPFARHAVWANYEAVYTFGVDLFDRTGKRASVTASGDAENLAATTLHTFTQDPHQGVSYDHDNDKWYVFDTNKIYRFDEDFTTLEATNSDPCGDANTALGESLDHLCDGTIANGYIVVPIDDYVGSGGNPTVTYLARFDLATLAFVDAVDVSADRLSISSICWDVDRSYYVSCYWSSMTALDMWDTSFNHVGTIPLSNYTPFAMAQGIEYFAGAYWVTNDSFDETYRIEVDGTTSSGGLIGLGVSGSYEGICEYKGSLVVLSDPSSANSYLTRHQPFGETLYAGQGAEHSGSTAQYKETTVGSLGTTWTMAVSYEIDSATQMALMTYRDASSGATNDRVTLAIDDGDKAAVWDNVNSWLYASPSINPGTGTPHRIATSYAGTTRKLFHDGALVNTQTGITARDADFDMITMGTDDETRADPLDGKLGFAYLRSGALSTDWLAAEYANLNNPSGFYSIS